MKVAPEVLDGLDAVRESGATNMMDQPRVAELAGEMGYSATEEWVLANRKDYAKGVFEGFEVD